MRSIRIVLLWLCMVLLSACGDVLPDEGSDSSTTGNDVLTLTTDPTMQTTTPAASAANGTVNATAEEASTESLPTEQMSEAETAPVDEVSEAVRGADAAKGEVLFQQMTAAGFACSTCHRTDSEERLIGPGLLNIGSYAWTRIEGMSAESYLYASIVHPNDYIVETYLESLMPQTYSEIFSESEIYDITAYLMTLGDSLPPALASEDAPPTLEDVSTEDAALNTSIPETSASQDDVSEIDSTEAAITTSESDMSEVETETDPIEATEESVEPTLAATVPYVIDLEGLGWGVPLVGEALFEQALVDDMACSDCHYDNSEDTLVGPGLLNIAERAVELGEDPVSYLYESLIDTEIHPELSADYSEILTDAQILDLVAYMTTLIGDNNAVAQDDAIAHLIAAADVDHGNALFHEMNSTGFACSTCHYTDSSNMLVGPGLLGLPQRADERVPRQIAERYIYQSIISPDDYIVEGFPASVMPQTYADLFSQSDLYDLVAYLMTLSE